MLSALKQVFLHQKPKFSIAWRQATTPPRTKCYVWLFSAGDAGKLTQNHCAGERQSQNQTGAPDQIIAQLLLCSPFSVKPLCLGLTPSPRQLHMAEGEGEKRNISTNRRQLQCLNFYCLHAVIPNKASPKKEKPF